MVTAQNSMTVMTSGGTLITVVTVYKVLADEERRVVVSSGQVIVDGLLSGYGGKISVHGGVQFPPGLGLDQMDGGTYTSPSLPPCPPPSFGVENG